MSMSLHRCDHTNRQRQNVRMNAAVVVAVAAFASAMATGAPFLFGDLRDRALLSRARRAPPARSPSLFWLPLVLPSGLEVIQVF
ncbi:unnamed protein product [Sphagnum balticum]